MVPSHHLGKWTIVKCVSVGWLLYRNQKVIVLATTTAIGCEPLGEG